MTDSVRFSMRIPLDLKEKLHAQAQGRGIPLNQLILQALHTFVSGSSLGQESEALSKLDFRVSQLEAQMQEILRVRHGQILPVGDPHTPNPSDPNPLIQDGWDPVQCSFEDWLLQVWSKLARQDRGHTESDLSMLWGHPVTVERIHEMGFRSMHLRRFIDRLIEAAVETQELCLFPDEASKLELVDCRPGAITFLDPTEVHPSSNGKSSLH